MAVTRKSETRDALVLSVARYFEENRCTVRATAKVFNISKSTVHKMLTTELPNINQDLSRRVKNIMDFNFTVKHIRGGEQTKRKHSESYKAAA